MRLFSLTLLLFPALAFCQDRPAGHKNLLEIDHAGSGNSRQMLGVTGGVGGCLSGPLMKRMRASLTTIFSTRMFRSPKKPSHPSKPRS
jgi:hypothetical protein